MAQESGHQPEFTGFHQRKIWRKGTIAVILIVDTIRSEVIMLNNMRRFVKPKQRLFLSQGYQHYHDINTIHVYHDIYEI